MDSTLDSRITTSFNAQSTAADVSQDLSLAGKRAIVTGASSGIGIETARALVAIGADVTLAVRDTQAGARVAIDIAASTGRRAPRVETLELTDRASIARFVDAWDGPLDVLINNAGIMALPDLHRTPEGWEMQLATNHLGHFVLALGLHDALVSAGAARIVSLSSIGHRRSPVIFDDLHFTSRPYDMGLAYGQSKTANVLFAVEATRRWGGDGITANAVHPGAIAATNLARHLDPDRLAALQASAPYGETFDGPRMRYKTIEQGAATSVLVATSPRLDGIGGRYFEDCNEAEVVARGESAMRGVAAYALDPESAARLWEMSVQMVGQ
jgi:NAD(P)-dependent dehydrogenase (short-subunit alcohol dehydrogenase family)